MPDQDPAAGSLTVVPDPLGVNGYSLEIAGGGQTPEGFAAPRPWAA